jgi:hypothetical protein
VGFDFDVGRLKEDHMGTHLLRLSVVFGFLAVFVAFSPGAGAQAAAELTIHARTCPSSEAPADFFATCHGNPANNVEYFDGSTSIGSTGADGNLVYDLGSPGSVDLNGGVPGEFARNFIYCSNNGDQSVVVDFREVEAGTSVSVDVDENGTTCDWYVLPEDLSGNTPTPAPAATSTPSSGVTQLPNTGTGTSNGGTNWMLLALIVAALGLASTGVVSVARTRR